MVRIRKRRKNPTIVAQKIGMQTIAVNIARLGRKRRIAASHAEGRTAGYTAGMQ
jgi:hypothetical protein